MRRGNRLWSCRRALRRSPSRSSRACLLTTGTRKASSRTWAFNASGYPAANCVAYRKPTPWKQFAPLSSMSALWRRLVGKQRWQGGDELRDTDSLGDLGHRPVGGHVYHFPAWAKASMPVVCRSATDVSAVRVSKRMPMASATRVMPLKPAATRIASLAGCGPKRAAASRRSESHCIPLPAGYGLRKLGQQSAVGHVAVVVRVGVASHQRHVRVSSCLRAALTERHRVGRCSVEALVHRRYAGGDQLHLGHIQRELGAGADVVARAEGIEEEL